MIMDNFLPSGAAGSDFSLLLPRHYREDVVRFLQQDMPSFDVGAFVVGSTPVKAHLLAKTPGILAGMPFFNAVFEELGCEVQWFVTEGCRLDLSSAAEADARGNLPPEDTGDFDATPSHFRGRKKIAEVTGPVCRVLQGERTALNIISRCSGIATQANHLAAIKQEHGWHGEIAATRKVTPGFRLFEKYAVIVGGGVPHRMTLSDMTMLKDNHCWACGGDIQAMVRKARSACGFSNKIEVECQSLAEALEAAGAGAEVVMLDNFPAPEAKAAAAKLKEQFPHGLTVEISGGLNEETAAEYFSEHVDVLSFGGLTHGYDVLDFSLKVVG
ncbi:qprt [Symbiodinium sp. CCMP2592]|nr:qprt [Symbiodinium sp. CCMP2592]